MNDADQREHYRRTHPRVRPVVVSLPDETEPSIHSSTFMLREWRAHLEARAVQLPGDRDIPRFLDFVVWALDWRVMVPPVARFWRSDEATAEEPECWRKLIPSEYPWWR